MDIKDLNKPQLLLLAVLLSFITSIATGITTVTLMQQAPPSFTTPVNRVIQQTVEKIQQVEGKTVTQTVVVKEEDLVVDAIAKNQSAVFTVTKNGYDSTGASAEVSAGRGFAVSTDGVIAVDASQIADQGTYFVKNSSGKFKAAFISTNKAGFSFLKIGDPVNSTDKASFTVPSAGDLSKMKIGQKIILFGGGVSSSIYDGNNNPNLIVPKTDAGGLVLDLDGNALGMAIYNDTANFVAISVINDALKASSATVSQ